MHHRDDKIGPVPAARLGKIEAHLLIFTPGDAGPVVVGLEAARSKLVVAKKSNAQTLALDDQGLVRTRQIERKLKGVEALPVADAQAKLGDLEDIETAEEA